MEDKIKAILTAAHQDRVAPGAIVGYIKNGQSGVVASGRFTYEADSAPVKTNTIYDVASITKSIPLAALAHLALAEGKLSVDTKAQAWVPELVGKYHQFITIEHLLTYTAIWKLPMGLSRLASSKDPQVVLDTIYQSGLVEPPGKQFRYTSAPAIFLGLIIERVYGQTLDRLARERIFEPLGMSQTSFDVVGLDDSQVAPTEIDSRGLVHKIPHDEATGALRQAGMVGGAAGLFSTAGDLLAFCQVLLNEGVFKGQRLFAAKTVETFQQNRLKNIGESAALGWELNQPRIMGKHANPQMFGKTGFTGCLVLVDIKKQTAMVLLSNAQYPKRHPNKDAINKLRRDLADIIFA